MRSVKRLVNMSTRARRPQSARARVGMFASRCLFSRLSNTQDLLYFEEVTGSALYLAAATQFALCAHPTRRLRRGRISVTPLSFAHSNRHLWCRCIPLRFTSFVFGACVRRAPNEPAPVISVVKNPRQNLTSQTIIKRRIYPIFYHFSPMGTVPQAITSPSLASCPSARRNR